MKLIVFGSDGMLGKAVFHESVRRSHKTIAVNHKNVDISRREDIYKVFQSHKVNAVINCAGIIPISGASSLAMLEANAVGPIILSEACKRYDIRLVHVSTDCVFSGDLDDYKRYDLDDITNASDIYGRTKAIGEIIHNQGNVAVVRTSFIGPDHGLLNWLLTQKEPEIEGWINALWTGSSVFAVARGLLDICESDRKGIVHLSTKSVWNKYEVLVHLKEALGIDVIIKEKEFPYINRALLSTHELEDISSMRILRELAEYSLVKSSG